MKKSMCGLAMAFGLIFGMCPVKAMDPPTSAEQRQLYENINEARRRFQIARDNLERVHPKYFRIFVTKRYTDEGSDAEKQLRLLNEYALAEYISARMHLDDLNYVSFLSVFNSISR